MQPAFHLLWGQFTHWEIPKLLADPIRNPDAAQEISTAAAVIHAPILVGAVLERPDYAPDNPASTNTVIDRKSEMM